MLTIPEADLLSASGCASLSACDEWMLEGFTGESTGLTQAFVSKNPFSIGRSPSVDFRIDCRNVSKLHADLISGGNDTLFVRDLGSANGTFVNGVRITQATPIGEGDLVQFADMEFRLRRRLVHPENTLMSDRPQEGWLISRLHQVLTLRQFTMAFQPIVTAGSRETTGYEALVRCQVPGLESPLKLFDAAERLHLEERLSELCRQQAMRLLDARHPKRLLFVNTHPSEQLGEDLVASMQQLQHLVPGRQIVLEIHEAAVTGIPVIRTFRERLREINVLLAYDDFGAGQSRLLELTEVPPDYLKFDRGLLKNLKTATASQRSLVQTLVNLAAERGCLTVAEGLDDAETIQICCDMGFTHLQGFHLGRPMLVEAL